MWRREKIMNPGVELIMIWGELYSVFGKYDVLSTQWFKEDVMCSSERYCDLEETHCDPGEI